MAIFQIDFFAKTLKRKVQMAAVIPMDVPPGMAPNFPDVFKPVFLLHGYSGNHNDWLCSAPLQELALQHGLAFIMPDGENNFYLNDPIREAMYEDFICDELPAFCRKLFPISCKPAETTVGGLSMGGFGAIHSGLSHPEIFGNIIALSSALITDEVSKMKEGQGNQVASYDYYRHVFGSPENLSGSHNDPKALAEELNRKTQSAPNIYIACGTEDFLIKENRDFHKCLQSLNIKHEYVEGPGVHDWVFWNTYLVKALTWLKPHVSEV
ncbi:alpha-xylosidase [Spirochaetia bacterium]|nr:alpha-xylosidase [Spirochaetia bacterium]GHU68957.1 alpha-xylosidase [Spirochaetia bacterium]